MISYFSRVSLYQSQSKNFLTELWITLFKKNRAHNHLIMNNPINIKTKFYISRGRNFWDIQVFWLHTKTGLRYWGKFSFSWIFSRVESTIYIFLLYFCCDVLKKNMTEKSKKKSPSHLGNKNLHFCAVFLLFAFLQPVAFAQNCWPPGLRILATFYLTKIIIMLLFFLQISAKLM